MRDTSEPTYLGVDWASGRWVVVGVDGDSVTVTTEPSILNVWHEYGDAAEAILVDIPIGFPQRGPRECDEAAREMLGGRGSSVFSVPCREAVYAPDYETAREANEDADCGGLGSQSWGIVPRIREADVFLENRKEAKEAVFESHQEWSENELPSKADPDGIDGRLDVLEAVDTEFGEGIRGFVDQRRDGNAAWHERIQADRIGDVLNAAVLAMTAKHCHPSYSVLPADATIDDISVIVFP